MFAFCLLCSLNFHEALNIKPRDEAPKFTAKAVLEDKFITVSSDDYKGKWVVLLFYPYDFTFVCPTEIISFRLILYIFLTIIVLLFCNYVTNFFFELVKRMKIS